MAASILSTENMPLHLRLLYELEAAFADPEACSCMLVRELTGLADWFHVTIVSEEEKAELLSENAIHTVAMTLRDSRVPSGDIALIEGFHLVTNLIASPCFTKEQDHLACFFAAMGGLGGFVGLMEHHQSCPVCSATILQMLNALYHRDVIADELFGTHWTALVSLVEDALGTLLDISPAIFKILVAVLLKFEPLLRSLDRRVALYIRQSLVEYMECPLCVILGKMALEEILGSSSLVKLFVTCACCASGVGTCSAAA
jgi:hypothetical protein